MYHGNKYSKDAFFSFSYRFSQMFVDIGTVVVEILMIPGRGFCDSVLKSDRMVIILCVFYSLYAIVRPFDFLAVFRMSDHFCFIRNSEPYAVMR